MNTTLRLENNFICHFDSKGNLNKIVNGDKAFDLKGIRFDVGRNGKYVNNQLEWSTFQDFHTWDLPPVSPVKNASYNLLAEYKSDENSLSAIYNIEGLKVVFNYTPFKNTLKLSVTITNTELYTVELNGFAFLVDFINNSGVKFDFPANVPNFICEVEKLENHSPVCAGLVNAATRLDFSNGNLNLVFIDLIEKWSCGVYKENDNFTSAYIPALEVNLAPDETIEVGDLFIQPLNDENPYLAIRELYTDLGYSINRDGINDGIMYSCHPAGTMDKNFPLKNDLYKYAEYLPELKEMGVDHIWLLPIFDHGENGVYHSTDQAIIDERYGGDGATKYYIEKAHELGMTVLFDYVPHGPTPNDPLAQKTFDWCSRKKDGHLQIEWDCVSYDYNNPAYQKYTTDLIIDHVNRFDVDGARIDCAMGGLSNWRPLLGERPSGNSLRAGVNITKATRDGFLAKNKQSFILPENFHPLPQYFSETDIYYGMSLYRVFCELEEFFHKNPTQYVESMTSWLEREQLSLPEGYSKLRFLGNHDTVSWVWQAARATDLYTVEGAKALWAMITLLDGMPMIYQGDEDPSWYDGDAPVLKTFFKDLFAARKKYLKDNYTIKFHYTNSPVMAFSRNNFPDEKLVLINMSNEEQVFNADSFKTLNPLLQNTTVSGTVITLPPYTFDIFEEVN